eukprot:363096-Chlamydomonas_euryale.AAC.14
MPRRWENASDNGKRKGGRGRGKGVPGKGKMDFRVAGNASFPSSGHSSAGETPATTRLVHNASKQRMLVLTDVLVSLLGGSGARAGLLRRGAGHFKAPPLEGISSTLHNTRITPPPPPPPHTHAVRRACSTWQSCCP